MKLANQALTDVRRRVGGDLHGRRGRRSDLAWAPRRLLRGRERLSDKQFTTIRNELVDADPTHQILTAWIGRETPGAARDREEASAETVRKRVRRAEIDAGVWPGLSSAGHAEVKRLKREVAELRRANEILKAAAAFFGSLPR